MSGPKPLPDIATLQERFSYDASTGVLMVLRREGWQAARPQPSHKYIRVHVGKVSFYAHRVAWKLYYGSDPGDGLDHINGDRLDNRIVNLRIASAAQNNANKASKNCLGKGVRFDAKTEKFRSSIRVGGKRHELGYYASQAEAVSAYRGAALIAFGTFAHSSISEV